MKASTELADTVSILNLQNLKSIRRTFMTGFSKTLSPSIEEKYQQLKELYARRRQLMNAQEFQVLWLLTLQRLRVDPENVLSLNFDPRNRNCVIGVWLKKRDYAGKLWRKAEAQARLQQHHDAAREAWNDHGSRDEDSRVPWGPPTVKPTSKFWNYSDYAIIDPPIYPPALWLEACGEK